MKASLIIAALVISLSLAAEADCPVCMICTDSCTSRAGYQQSGVGGICGDKDCNVAAPSSQSYLDSAHPGLFTRMGDATLVVTGVLPESPAEKAGIAVGDEILQLNGENPIFSCSSHQWQSKGDRHSADLVISRKETRRYVKVSLLPVRQLLAREWQGEGQRVKLASLDSANNSDESLWLFGFKWRQGSKVLEVTDVLLGSPAERAGLAIGDRITALNGFGVQNGDSHVLALLFPRNPAQHVQLTVEGNAGRQIDLSSESVSQVLRDLAETKHQPHPNSEMAAGLF